MNLNCGALSEPCSVLLAHKVQGWVVSRFYLAPSDSKYCRWRNTKCHLNLFLYILLGIYWSDTLALNSVRVIKGSPLAFSNTFPDCASGEPSASIQHSAVTAQIQNQHTTKSMLPAIDWENLSVLGCAKTETKGDTGLESENVSEKVLKLHVFSESASWLNLSVKGAAVGMWTSASIRTHFLSEGWMSFFFGCPGKFVQNIRKQNKIPKVGFSWVSLSLERKQSLWSEHLPKLLKSIWAGWESLGALLMQWNVAQVFVIAACIKGGRTTLPLTLKCFHENGNECYRGLFPLNAQGSEALKGCFHYAINRASYSLSFFPPSLFKSAGAWGSFLGSARQCCVFPASQGSKSHSCSQMGPAEIHPLSSFQLHFLHRETALTHLARRGRL